MAVNLRDTKTTRYTHAHGTHKVEPNTKEYSSPRSSLPSLLTCTSPTPKNTPLSAPPSPPYSLVPVGELHHDVEGGQHHQSMEEGVAVGDPILLVVHVAHLPLLVAVFSVCAKPTTCTTRCALRRQGRETKRTHLYSLTGQYSQYTTRSITGCLCNHTHA